MKRAVLVLLVLSVLLIAGQAMALEQPTIISPSEGATLGPNYDVIGNMPYRALVVVMTDVIDCDTDQVIASVPGIRHWTNADGSFHFRVAAPRVSLGERETSVAFRVRVFEATANAMSDEATIMAQCVIPSPEEARSIIPVGMQESGLATPRLSSPVEGTALGPNYDVIGQMPDRSFLVVVTDVIDPETNEVLRTVPGIRNWTREDGSFHFRVAAPRPAVGPDVPLNYRVRVYEMLGGETGPEAVVNASRAQ